MFEPEPGVGGQERRDFGAAEIVDVGAPILVEALAGIGMLVEMRAVELAETVRVEGEVPRHPIEHHADAGLVRGVDEGREVVRRSVAARRGEQRHRLVAPRSVERKLRDRQHLDMGEAHVLDVGDQALAHLLVRQVAVALVRNARP